MTLQFKVFRSTVSTWNTLFEQASKFATSIGQERVVNITTSSTNSNEGIVVVWYWS